MNHDIPMFTDLLLIIGAVLPVLFLFRRFGLPPIAGFVLTGMIIGPYGFGLINTVDDVNVSAEIGVVLLLFSVGLEFSLSRLLSTPRILYFVAIGQILGTTALGVIAASALGLSLAASVVIGFVLTLSSSALVLKGLSDLGELETPLGRAVVTVCVAQDFAIVPMMVTLGVLVSGETNFVQIGKTVAVVAGLVLFLYVIARYALPVILQKLLVVRTSEVMLLFTILMLLGTAWLTAQAGLSLALGAFAAGLILSETPYIAQIYAEVAPFRSLFSSLFFVSVGMLLDLGFVAQNPLPVLAVALGVLLLKTIVVVAVCLPFKLPLRLSIQGGFYIAQIGEFSFLVIGIATTGALISESVFQYLIAAASITLAVTPFIMQWAPRLAERAESRLSFLPKSNIANEPPAPHRPSPAVLVVGYGVNGQNVSRVLAESGIYHEILEHNPEIVRRSREKGVLIHFGDVTLDEVLRHLHIKDFDSIVIAISDPSATRRATAVIREFHASVHLIVRTRLVAEVEALQNLGANIVVPEEFETSLRIFSELLEHYHIPPHIIQMQVEIARGQSYGVLRASQTTNFMDKLSSLLMARLVEAVPITADCIALNKTPAELDLINPQNCSVIAVLRNGLPLTPPFDSIKIQQDDLLVLYGNHAALNEAMQKLV